MPLLDDYYSTPELSAELGVCVKTIERWTRLSEGPPLTKLGGKTYFRKDSTREWLKSREQSPKNTRRGRK